MPMMSPSISPSPPPPHVLPKIGITMGDPTGIGPEIIVKALSSEEIYQACQPIVFGDEKVLLREVERENLPIQMVKVHDIPDRGHQPGKVLLIPSSSLEADTLVIGNPDRRCGEAMVKYIEEAVKGIEEKKLHAITTCPINKKAIHEAGYQFSGHTELLAHLSGVSRVAMMFIGSKWRVVLATTHLPIQEVSRWITRDRLRTILELTGEGLKRYFGLDRPRVAILGLNPHCGEEGVFGEEEQREILPAIEEARVLGLQVEGPFPADSFFGVSGRPPFDAVIAMYHDQGLIPMKMAGLGELVHLTLGLPFIRTSVAHGTAYDIAGKGMADPSSLIKAIVTAAKLASRKRSGLFDPF